MKTGQYPLRFLMGLLAVFCLGIVCGACSGISLSVHRIYLIAAILILFSASVILVLKQHERTWIAFVGLFFVAGMFRFAGAYELPAQDVSRAAGEDHHGDAARHGTHGWVVADSLYGRSAYSGARRCRACRERTAAPL